MNDIKDYQSDAARWAAVLMRDAAADAHFVYAVRTTGAYWHPSAGVRRPKRENVEFFDSPAAARAAGYHAGRRGVSMRTRSKQASFVAQACRLIEAAETPPTLEDLAAEMGVSPFHLHRVFKAALGLTPKAYAAAFRARRVRSELQTRNTSITAAIYSAGFNSNSRFYETADRLLGMRARDYQAGGRGATIRFAVGRCALGDILVAQSQQGICAISLGDSADALVRELQDQFPQAQLIGGDPAFERLVAEVVGFVERPSIGLHLPLDIRGTAFQERVWRALREIPPGATANYAEIARRIGAPKAARAVALACAANRIAVAIPCHRVIRRDGDLAGYRWGVARKRALLQREEAAPAALQRRAD